MSDKTNLLAVMAGIEPPTPLKEESFWDFANVSTGNYDPPSYMVAFLFLTIMDFHNYGEMIEKVWWHTYFKYKGHVYIIRDYKFGTWSLEARKEDTDAAALVPEIAGKIRAASRHADNLLQDEFKAQVSKGEFYFNNGYSKLRDAYEFYSDEAHAALKSLSQFRVEKSGKIIDFKEIENRHNEQFSLERLITYRMTPVIIAFFSLLEFLLDVLYAFSQPLLTFFAFREMVWQERFKTVIPLIHGTEITRLYERLVNIKRNFRNPLTHGLTNISSLLVPFPFAGLVPLSYEHLGNSIHFSYAQIPEANAEDIISTFTGLLEYLATTEPFCFHIIFLEYGFSVPIAPRAIARITKQMTSIESFQEFLDGESRYQDAVINREI